MIYLDTSVLLGRLLAEDRTPPDSLWDEALVSSRLIEYEIWTRLNVLDLGESHGDAARSLLARVALLELLPNVLERALAPFPTPVRTLDALHLASAAFLTTRDRDLRVATWDRKLAAAAEAMGLPSFEP